MSTILLKNAILCDGRMWNVRGDVFVENGMIIDVGQGFSGDETYDLSGYTLLPGFFDAHVHMVSGPSEFNDAALKSWAQSGVLTVRDLGLGNAKPTEDYMAWRKSVALPECAEIITAGRCIAAAHGYMHMMGGNENGIGVNTPEEAVAAIERQLAIGCDGIKTASDIDHFDENTPQHSPQTLSAIALTAKNHHVWCTAHVLQSRFLRKLVESGIPEMAHMVLDPIPEDLLDEMVIKQVAVTCTLQSINAPRPPLPKTEVTPELMRMIKLMEQVDTAQQEREALDNTRRFHEKGGMVVMGTDTMRMEDMPHVATIPIHELQLLHKAGLSIPAVIAASTINAAKACKVDAIQGTIETGKKANLIAIREALNETFEALSHVEFVMNHGVVIKNVPGE